MGRAIGLDVHRDFCEVAIAEDGKIRRGGRFETKPEVVELFARTLGADDEVVMETPGGSVAIARILEPTCDAWSSPTRRRAGDQLGQVKSDKFDARTLARLLAAPAPTPEPARTRTDA